MHEITRSPYSLALGLAASLFMAVSCSDDDDDGGSNNGGSSGSAGEGGSSGASGKGGSSGKAGSSTGGSNTGGSNTGGKAGSAGAGPTGGTAGTAGTGGDAGMGGEPTDGGMGGVPTDGGMGGEGGEMVVADVLDNPGFEMGNVGPLLAIPGWQEDGDLDASYVEWTGGRNSTHKLGHWRAWVATTAETYTTSTFQTVGPIPNGTYSFSMWINRKQVLTTQYLFARGHNIANTAEQITMDTAHTSSEAGYTQITLSGIQVTSGQVTVGIHTSSWGNDWSNIDDATLTMVP